MTGNHLQKEITIIKEMIEKTRRETAESGLLFIIPGILCIITILLTSALYSYNLGHLARPVLFICMAVIALSSAYIGYLESKKKKVETYTKKIFSHLWMACGMGCLITGLIFPLLKVYSWEMLGIIPFVILGIGFFVTGALYQLPLIQWCSLIWWIGACLIPLFDNPFSTGLIIGIFLFGYILPGIIMNRQYRTRSKQHEA